MGAMLGTNDLVQKAERKRKGRKWEGDVCGSRARRQRRAVSLLCLFPLPPPASPAQSLVSKMGQGKAGCAATARAEPKLQAQVFFPKFLDPLTGALRASNPAHRRAAPALPRLLGRVALRLPGASSNPRLGFEGAEFW